MYCEDRRLPGAGLQWARAVIGRRVPRPARSADPHLLAPHRLLNASTKRFAFRSCTAAEFWSPSAGPPHVADDPAFSQGVSERVRSAARHRQQGPWPSPAATDPLEIRHLELARGSACHGSCRERWGLRGRLLLNLLSSTAEQQGRSLASFARRPPDRGGRCQPAGPQGQAITSTLTLNSGPARCCR